jgi:NAD(P)-dependent dehydrogenase (short-subunit alcohol dehydrogenase family)
LDIGTTGEEFSAVASQYPDKLFALEVDVTKEETIQKAVDQIVEEAGAIHGMVCNAGRTKHKAALDFTTEEIEQLWGVNVSSSSFGVVIGKVELVLIFLGDSYMERSTRRAWQHVPLSNSTSRDQSSAPHPWRHTGPTK